MGCGLSGEHEKLDRILSCGVPSWRWPLRWYYPRQLVRNSLANGFADGARVLLHPCHCPTISFRETFAVSDSARRPSVKLAASATKLMGHALQILQHTPAPKPSGQTRYPTKPALRLLQGHARSTQPKRLGPKP